MGKGRGVTPFLPGFAMGQHRMEYERSDTEDDIELAAVAEASAEASCNAPAET